MKSIHYYFYSLFLHPFLTVFCGLSLLPSHITVLFTFLQSKDNLLSFLFFRSTQQDALHRGLHNGGVAPGDASTPRLGTFCHRGRGTRGLPIPQGDLISLRSTAEATCLES